MISALDDLQPQSFALEAYIAQHGLDEQCAANLRALAPAAQLQVMQTDVTRAHTVSSAVSAHVSALHVCFMFYVFQM